MLRAVARLNDLKENDVVNMLCRKRKREIEEEDENQEKKKVTDIQYRIFVQTIYRSSFKFCRDIREISFLIDVLLPKLRLVCDEKTTPREVVRRVTELLQSRANQFMFTHDLDNFENRSAGKMRIAQNFPVRQRIMLVAAFLSSWNPAGTDTQFRAAASIRTTSKRKRSTRSSVRSSDWEKIRLKGPQTFTFYRLWDNYKAMLTNSDIVNSKLLASDRSSEGNDLNTLEMLEPTNANDFAMVNTLVECHLLQQTSSSVLNPRYRCIAPKEMVATCARYAGIKLEDHLLHE